MTTITMPSRRQTARQRCKWAAACGELDAMGMLATSWPPARAGCATKALPKTCSKT